VVTSSSREIPEGSETAEHENRLTFHQYGVSERRMYRYFVPDPEHLLREARFQGDKDIHPPTLDKLLRFGAASPQGQRTQRQNVHFGGEGI
jgi:hypothetical protein